MTAPSPKMPPIIERALGTLPRDPTDDAGRALLLRQRIGFGHGLYATAGMAFAAAVTHFVRGGSTGVIFLLQAIAFLVLAAMQRGVVIPRQLNRWGLRSFPLPPDRSDEDEE